MIKIILNSALLLLTSSIVFGQSVTILPQDINSNTTSSEQLTLKSISVPSIVGVRISGTLDVPAATNAGNNLIRMVGKGFGTSFTGERGAIGILASENWTATTNGTYMDFFTTQNGTTSSLSRMRIENDGNVGIGSVIADFPLHVTNTAVGTSSTTGAFAIGATTSSHLVFDNNQIDSWANTTGNTLFLNYYSNAKVQIGNGSTGNLDVNGFVNLGDGAPKIKMLKFSGTTDASFVTLIPHGLTASKIISVNATILYAGVYYAPGANYNASFLYDLVWNSINIQLDNVGANLQSKTYVVTVIYEE